MIRRFLSRGAAEVVPSQSVAPEQSLSVANRVVVYGTNLSGAKAAATALQACMEQNNIENPLVEHIRFVDSIKPAFFGQPPAEPHTPPTLPRGVIIFPDMRVETPGGSLLTVLTPAEAIIQLCTRHDVPYALYNGAPLPEEIMHGANVLGSGSPPTLPPAA